MRVRNPFAFALAILCLVSSASLGILFHDGAVGFDDLSAAQAGDDVRFRATSAEADSLQPLLSAWSFQTGQADLLRAGDDTFVIVLHEGEPMLNGTWVVEGVVRGTMPYNGWTVAIVQAEMVTEPFLFA